MKRDEAQRVTRAFGAAVRFARKRLRISQVELAEQCALDRTYISGIERGTRNPTVVSIWRIAAALQLQPSELFVEAERLLLSNHPERDDDE